MDSLTRWLFFNLAFGVIPYPLMVALDRLQAPGEPPLLHPSSEVLFIALVATSSSLGELWDDDEPALVRRRPPWRGRWQLLLLLGVLLSSLLYGAYVYHSLMSPGRSHGIDCGALSALSAQPDPTAGDRRVLAEWSGPCRRGVQVQHRSFSRRCGRLPSGSR